MPTEETTIDCTPTWEQITPVIIQGLQSDRFEAIKDSTSELTRCAQLADRYNKLTKHLSCVFRVLGAAADAGESGEILEPELCEEARSLILELS